MTMGDIQITLRHHHHFLQRPNSEDKSIEPETHQPCPFYVGL